MSIFRTIVGLDIGSHSIKAAWLQWRGGVLTLQRTEQLTWPAGAADPDRLIRSWVNHNEIARCPCALALPGGQTVFQPGRRAPEDPRPIHLAAAMEVQTFNDLAGDQMLHDVCEFEWRPGTRHYLLAMARPVSVDRALQQAADYGLRVVDLIPAPAALFAWYEREAPPTERPRLILHVGHEQTELAVGANGGLLFARSVAAGGRALTDAVAQARGITAVQAEALKHKEGTLATPRTPPRVALPGPDPETEKDAAAAPRHETLEALLTPVADRWIAQVQSCVAVYKSQFPGEAFALGEVVVGGGGAHLAGLAERLAERLDLPLVRAARRLPRRIEGSPPEDRYALACGLAAMALEIMPLRLSLLPARLRDESIFRAKKPYWIAAGVLGALALGIFTVSGLRELDRERRRLETEGTALQQREQTARNIRQVQQRDQAIRRNVRPLREMLMSGPLFRDLVTLTARAIHPEDWISMICDEASYIPSPSETPAPRIRRTLPGMRDLGPQVAAARRAAAAPPPRTMPMRVFIVEGYTPEPSLETVRDLIARIKRDRRIVQADLMGDDRVLPPAWTEDAAPAFLTNLTHFVVRVEMKDP